MMNKHRRFVFFAVAFLISSVFFIYPLSTCHEINKNSHPGIPDSSIEKGKRLASLYCGNCHLLPDPGQLDKKSWEKGVLPEMGPRLGIFDFMDQNYPSSRYDGDVSRSFYPSKPILDPGEWKNILDYYMSNAPDSLGGQNRKVSIRTGLKLFTGRVPKLTYENPVTGFVAIDTSVPEHRIVISDISKKTLYRFNHDLQLIDSISTKKQVVGIDFQQHEMTLCNIGILNPSNGKYGTAEHVRINGRGKMHLDSPALFNELARPVQITSVDFNQDGKKDYLVCEFGNLNGALSWMENQGDGNFKRHLLRASPGAIKAWVQDYNHDGLPDIWVLFAQGDEGIFLFTNKGQGKFEQQEVLRFPPMYGSSYFELADFNHDGFPDIVYTCGDNADYSRVLKPYHGVYIFMNDGKNHFKQQYFFPINGCYKAVARDFDGDGDLDIAAISFFADYARHPEEGFVYLENKGNLEFLPYTVPEAKDGRWLTMDVADLDGDGRPDIILGNFSIAPAMIKSKNNWKHGPPFLVLKNTGIK
jgi:FG-GAP-like repeat